MSMKKNPRYSAPALEKGLDVLECLADGAAPQSLNALARALGRTSSEIFRMLDVFIFGDAGSVNFGELSWSQFRATAGGGIRLDIGNRTPVMIGWGYVFNKDDRKNKAQPFFFSMGGQF